MSAVYSDLNFFCEFYYDCRLWMSLSLRFSLRILACSRVICSSRVCIHWTVSGPPSSGSCKHDSIHQGKQLLWEIQIHSMSPFEFSTWTISKPKHILYQAPTVLKYNVKCWHECWLLQTPCVQTSMCDIMPETWESCSVHSCNLTITSAHLHTQGNGKWLWWNTGHYTPHEVQQSQHRLVRLWLCLFLLQLWGIHVCFKL